MKTDNKQVTALTAVNIEQFSVTDEVTEEAKGAMAVGAFEAHLLHQKFSELMTASHLSAIKRQKLYKTAGFPTWEAFIDAKFSGSRPTADRLIADLEKLGAGWFQLREVARVSREVFAAANPQFQDGHVLIDGEKIKLTQSNAPAIQDAFQRCLEAMREAKQSASDSKADAEKAKGERDNAQKAAAEARKKLHAAQAFKMFADADGDEDYRVMLEVQSRVDTAMVILAELRGREMSEASQDTYAKLCRYMYFSFLRAVDDALFSFPRPLDPVEPWMALELNSADPIDNPIAEYVAKGKKK
jgi:hypothetical protein